MIDIQGTTVNIDAGSIMLKGGMFTHVPGGGGGGGGGGAGGGSGSADFAQSEIGKYAGFTAKQDSAITAKTTSNTKSTAASNIVNGENPITAATPAAQKPAIKTPVLPSDPQVVNAAWAKPRVEVGTAIDMAFIVMNFKGGEAVKIKVYEFDKNGLNDIVDTINTKLKIGSGQLKATWTPTQQQANKDLAQDQAAGDTGPLEYKFEVEIAGSKATKMSGPLNLTKTITVDAEKNTGVVLTEGQSYELESADNKVIKSTVQNGIVTFKDVVVGPIKIYSNKGA
jgi:hypothetical protein